MTFLFDCRDDEGQTPMHYAVYAVLESRNDSIKNMVDVRGETSLGELFNAVDKEGNSPLSCAKSSDTVKMILELDTQGEILQARMLQNAAREGNVNMVTELVSHCLTRDEPDEDGTTAFTCALGTLNTGKP